MSDHSNGQQPQQQQQPQQPNPQTIINVQRQEIDRANDNRVYLMAIIEENRRMYEAELSRLAEEISLLKTSENITNETK